MKGRKICLVIVITILVFILIVFLCNQAIINSSENKVYNSVSEIPFNKVGLLLGTGKYLNSGSVNPYYTYRIAAAETLMKAGKIKYVIISGDNSSKDYNEPEQMRQDLIKAGVDSAVIFLDYAGFRTFDSVIRLKEIFGQQSATIISQQFHNERAIFIASRENISAIGFNAQDVSRQTGFKVQLREKLARVKVFVDYLTRKKPKFLGEKIVIP